MNPLTDERIMAYVDGELPPEEADEIGRALEKDPEAFNRAEVFKQSAAMLEGVYDAPLNEAVPQRLLDVLDNVDRPKPQARIGILLSSFLHWPRWSPAYALTLLIALAGGIGTGYLAFHNPMPSDGFSARLLTGDALFRVLETTPSGQAAPLADGAGKITPVATFRDKNQHYCRQYEAEKAGTKDSGLIQGVACRTPSGQWWSFIEMTVTPDRISTDKTADYIPAGQEDLFSDVVEKAMAAPPLPLDQEKALIGRGWR